jgi:hypothetical protein
VYPFARPFSQSITAFGASDSFAPPTVGHPCDRPVPGDDEWTTAKPRGTHVLTCDDAIVGRRDWCAMDGAGWRGGGTAPSSWRTSQK